MEVKDGANTKKLVMIPWDYDRLNDSKARTRAPKGSPGHWYDSPQI
jgi:hypothetical protein